MKKFRLDIGCGNNKSENCLGIDIREIGDVDVIADVCNLPFRDNSVDKILVKQLLEHFENPYIPIEEIYRVIKPEGRVIITVPNWGTVSAIGDKDHKFIVDLNTWNSMLLGYFKKVITNPYGVRFRSVTERWIKFQNSLIKNGFYDLAQGFTFICSKKKKVCTREYVPWFLESKK